jgi:hypothetical protein
VDGIFGMSRREDKILKTFSSCDPIMDFIQILVRARTGAADHYESLALANDQ